MAAQQPGGGYDLGVDLGSSFVAAAVRRAGRAEVLPVGERSDLLPMAVGWAGGFVAGDAAERLAATQPDAVLRGLKGRVGDPTPVRLAGSTHTVETLMTQLLGQVVARARSRHGAPPTTVALTHPASWGPYRRDGLADIARAAGLGSVTLVSDPVAAATAYGAQQRLREGQLVAVYDFGGRAFEATLLRRTLDGFQVVGKPEGFVDLGGEDLDERLFAHVRERAGPALDHVDPKTPAGAAALAALRRDCALAKERLSREAGAPVLVRLPAGQLRVDVTRETFEALVRRPVEATVEALGDVLRSAGVEKRQLSATLLVGGSAQIPLVTQVMFAELGIRPVLAGHPKFAVPIGAVLAASQALAAPPEDDGRTEVVTIRTMRGRTGGGTSTLTWSVVAAVAVLVVVAVVVLLRGLLAG